jgi:hypothetical protein
MKGASVYDVSPDYLRKSERSKLSKANAPATIASNITDLNRIQISYTKVRKVIPGDYESLFSEIGYRIKIFIPNKSVLEIKEIKSIIIRSGDPLSAGWQKGQLCPRLASNGQSR